MSAEETIHDQFAKCHEELVARGEELGWRSLGMDTRYVALLEREVELARTTNDIALYEQCFDDVGELMADAQIGKYKEIEKELLCKAAELGSAKANLWLGHEYRAGKKRLRCFSPCFAAGRRGLWR